MAIPSQARRLTMRTPALLAWLAGIGLLAALLALNGAGQILEAVAALEFWLVIVVAFHAVPLFCDVVAWRRLFAHPPGLAPLFVFRWIGEGVNGLFPVPHLGELLRAQLAARHGRRGEAAASVVVDLTLGVASEVVYAALGLGIFCLQPSGSTVLRALLLGVALLAAAATAFYLLQRTGLFGLAAAIARRWPGPTLRLFDHGSAQALDDRVRAIYGRRKNLILSGAWRFVGWVVGAGEAWLALRGLGHPVGLGEAIILDSLSQAARTAAFAIPGGLGVQDGALLLLCGQLGIGPETALALSLAKRFREVSLGLPAMLAGYIITARRARE